MESVLGKMLNHSRSLFFFHGVEHKFSFYSPHWLFNAGFSLQQLELTIEHTFNIHFNIIYSRMLGSSKRYFLFRLSPLKFAFPFCASLTKCHLILDVSC